MQLSVTCVSSWRQVINDGNSWGFSSAYSIADFYTIMCNYLLLHELPFIYKLPHELTHVTLSRIEIPFCYKNTPSISQNR
jgi:hypothetical protein